MRLPWFRVHIVVLNDPGRLISTHLMHTAQISKWTGSMMLYEILIVDRMDIVFNPIWRQGCYVMPIVARLGVVSFNFRQALGINQVDSTWTYEAIVRSHISLSGLLLFSSQWHRTLIRNIRTRYIDK